MSGGFKSSRQSISEDAEFFSKDEYFDHVVYRELARMERDGPRRELLERLSEMEDKHYRFWSGYAEAAQVRGLRLRLFFILLLRKLMGIVFVIKLLERHESEVVARYRRVLERLDGDLREKVEEFLRDEEVHEKSLMSQLDEPVLKYIGFVALGLSDSIIEITGVHAGFLGVTASTLVAGVAGLIVGFAASISMGVAAYLKAKSELRHTPISSGLVTGLAYMVSTVLLAFPYFLTHDMITAFAASVSLAVCLATLFTYYVAVVQDLGFKREALENTALLMGTAIATYLFGEALGSAFGIRGAIR
ncbi:MAG: VIT1/CCC1 family protein [Thaumarchaeota archaeon]|nr:VIT1/CCC1 family protein [Candidatus Calditenuaceae archaeon]